MWRRSRIRYCGDRGFVYTRWLEKARGPSPPTVGTRAESKAEVNGSRAETGKAIKRSSTVVAMFKFDRFPPTHPNAQERGVLWARILRWSKCDQFPFYRESGQKRKLVCGLAQSVFRCFLGSGVLTSRRPLCPEFCGNFAAIFTVGLISRILEQITKQYDNSCCKSPPQKSHELSLQIRPNF